MRPKTSMKLTEKLSVYNCIRSFDDPSLFTEAVTESNLMSMWMLVYHLLMDYKKTILLFRLLSPHVLIAGAANDLKKWIRSYLLKTICHKIEPSLHDLISALANDALALHAKLKQTFSQHVFTPTQPSEAHEDDQVQEEEEVKDCFK